MLLHLLYFMILLIALVLSENIHYHLLMLFFDFDLLVKRQRDMKLKFSGAHRAL